jgi:hypothetical protein
MGRILKLNSRRKIYRRRSGNLERVRNLKKANQEKFDRMHELVNISSEIDASFSFRERDDKFRKKLSNIYYFRSKINLKEIN